MHPYLFKNYRDGLIFTVEGVQCLILMTLSEITYSSNSWEGREGGGVWTSFFAPFMLYMKYILFM